MKTPRKSGAFSLAAGRPGSAATGLRRGPRFAPRRRSVRREAVQVTRAAARLERVVAASARRVRRVPRERPAAECRGPSGRGGRAWPSRRRSWSSCRRSCPRPTANAVPSGCVPVRMSCSFGVSPRPLTTAPFSVSAVCLLRLLLAPCRSATSLAMTSPLAFFHGPLPMRSLALTAGADPDACVLRYARQVRSPAPTAAASFWQWASAPARPPKSAPLPDPVLVTKNPSCDFFACPGRRSPPAPPLPRPQ